MPRKHPPYRTDCPYHVTARTNNQEWFQIPLDDVWRIFEQQLFFIHHAYGVQIHAFVLMTNHFHLLISDPEGQLSKAMRWLMTETSRQINRKQASKNHVYGQRHYRTLIQDFHYFMHAYKYVYRNPVEAGACQFAHEYPYSTLRGLIGFEKLNVPLAQDTLLENDFEGTLNWIHQTPRIEDYETIQMAMKKAVFKLRVDRESRKESHLEEDRY